MRLWKWDRELHRGDKDLLRRVLILGCIPLMLVVGGTTGYYLLEEEYSVFDALYMTVITLTTVGYGETHILSQQGRAFTILLLLGGVFSIAYSASEILRMVVGGQLQDLLVGTTVRTSGLRQDLGVIVVAIIKAAGLVIYTPPGDAELHAGDTLIALGRRADLDLLERLADPHPHKEG